MFRIVSQQWLGCCVIALLISITVAQPNKNATKTLAILKLSANGVQEGLVRELSDALRMELEHIRVFKVLDYSTVESTLKEQGALGNFSCNQRTCAMEAGQLLGTELVAIGGVGLIDGTYAMNIRVIEINSGRMISDVDEYYSGKGKNLQRDLIPIVAAKLSGTPLPNNKFGKSPRAKAIIIGAGVAIAVPVVLLVRKLLQNRTDEHTPMTEVRVQWNE